MTIFIYIFVVALNITIGHYYNKRKRKKINGSIYWISFILIFLLMAGYRNTSGLSNDLIYHEIDFENVASGLQSDYEFGYIFLVKIGSYFTSDFYIFRSGIIALFLLMLFFTIKKWSPSPHYVIAFYTSYSSILSSEQLRYFLAFVLFIVGLSQFIYSQNKQKKLIFGLFLILAITIHFSFAIYFIFFINGFSENNRREKIIALLVLLFCIVIYLNSNQIPGLSAVLNEVENYKVSVYFNQSTKLGFLYPFFLHFLSILLMRWALIIANKTDNEELKANINNIYKLNLIAVIFFPLYMLQLTFYRLARNILMINYFGFSNFLTTFKKIQFQTEYISLILNLKIIIYIFSKKRNQ